MKNAIASIPAYIERSSHFLAVVPTVRHHDLADVTCDLGSWLERGWCRVELWALMLARFSWLPAIIIKGGEGTPFMMACQAAFARPPGCGSFSALASPKEIPLSSLLPPRLASHACCTLSQRAALAATKFPTSVA